MPTLLYPGGLRMTDRTDAELLALLARKDATATVELYERYFERAHRIAFRVLHDRDAAEDCAQEALSRIVERAASLDASAFSGLVYQVVLNEARNHVKKRARRAKHEETAARARPTASSARLEKGLEVAEVNAAVSELPEELRVPIVLHYFEGLSHDEVATALGMPKGTAASRLRRGIEKLQEHLAASGAAAVSAVALEETLRDPRTSPVPTPKQSAINAANAALRGAKVAAPFAGVALLKTGSAAAALVALVLVTVKVMLGPEPAAPRRAEVATPSTKSSAVATREGATDSRTSAKAPPSNPVVSKNPAPEVPSTIATTAPTKKAEQVLLADGVVVGPDKAPVAGASIKVEVESIAYLATAGADGKFEVKGALPPKKDDLVWVAARDPSRRFLGAQTLTPVPRKNLKLTLQAGAAVTGRVLDAATKKPLGGVRVEAEKTGLGVGSIMVLEETDSTTAEDGSFRLGPFRPGELRVVARAKDRATGRTKPLTLQAGKDTEVTIELGAGTALTGRVVDPDGKPLAGAAVGVYFGPSKQALITPEDWLEQACSERAAEVLIGRKLDSKDKSNMLGVGEDGKVALTDAEGRFRLEHLPAGKRRVICVHARFKTSRTFVKLAGETVDTQVALEPGGELHGFARKPDGTLAAGWVACAMGSNAGGRYGLVDASGRYSIPGLETGTYMLLVSDEETMPDFDRRQTAEVTSPDRVRADIGPAPAGARVKGRIMKGSVPVEHGGATLTPVEGTEKTSLQALSEDHGGFSFAGVAPGRYVLRAGEMLGSSSREVPITVPSGAGEVVCDVDLLLGSIEGRVEGGGLAGLAVATSAETGETRPAPIWPDGSFTIDGLSEGDWRVRCVKGGIGASLAAPVRVAKSARVSGISLTIAKGEPLEVTVQDMEGDACLAPHVVLAPAGEAPVLAGGLLADASGKEAGRVTLAAVPDGKWDVWAFADGRAAGVLREVEVGRDRSKKLVVKVPAAASLSVVVRDKEGKPVHGALLALAGLDGRSLWPAPTMTPKENALGPTDAEGKAAASLLPAGKLVVEARSASGKKARREVELSSGRESEIVLVLE